MNTSKAPSYLSLIMMISFASVNAVLFTPALPNIANYFAISESAAQQTITWFLVGYAIGQLIYGPIANRLGRKPALYIGISLQIWSSFLCVFSGMIHSYLLLVLGRFLLALGSGVGLKMTFTLLNETLSPQEATKKISYSMLAFAITPGLGVMIGGILNDHFGWTSTFYAGALYGFILLILTTQFKETKKEVDLNALKLSHLKEGYIRQFKNKQLIIGALLMGTASCFIYIFAALAPFIAINILHMSSSDYGSANLLPAIGLILGSLICARFAKKYDPTQVIKMGILITVLGSFTMLLLNLLQLSAIYSLFLPMIICYFGLSFVITNASTLAMSQVTDKSNGSAVMNFINMGLVTLVVFSMGLLPINTLIIPIIFILICFVMCILYTRSKHEQLNLVRMGREVGAN